MTEKLTEAELDKTLKSIISSYEKALERSKKNLTEDLAGRTVRPGTLADFITLQESAAPWLTLKQALTDQQPVAEALAYVRTMAVATVLNWEIGHTAQGVYQAVDTARFTAWQNFVTETKGLI